MFDFCSARLSSALMLKVLERGRPSPVGGLPPGVPWLGGGEAPAALGNSTDGTEAVRADETEETGRLPWVGGGLLELPLLLLLRRSPAATAEPLASFGAGRTGESKSAVGRWPSQLGTTIPFLAYHAPTVWYEGEQ
jgi:hypothetical protein